MSKSPSQRLDLLLVEQGKATSREQAQKIIRAGWVQVDQAVIDKPGTAVSTQAAILVKQRSPYVSRGGEKLAGAFTTFQLTPRDRTCLDCGISTGGFTDYLLKHGAALVYGIDVGYGQVAWELRNHPQVILRERTNLRHLQPTDLYAPSSPMPDLAVADLSFISLTKVLPAIWQLLIPPRDLVLLVKPQFEVGKAKVGKNGIVRDPETRAEAITQVLNGAIALGWQFQAMTVSPITGATGNHEYWLWLNQQPSTHPPTPVAIAQLALQ
ncbi:MAG: TlyA family RNA methyltransferase [Pseudanabaenaceae cyanobacterium bins.68]|nr:TlyA family RNA methyltransferase [Pseudanabaenaceae cyanobacterium bins.68]